MPEGDTLFRTAVNLRRWIAGRVITEARTSVRGLPVLRLVGRRVQEVEARGKHLLMRFEDGPVLHTHLRMTGSWHLYSAGEQWRRPERQARLVLAAEDRLAVCFNAPVIELLAPTTEQAHPALGSLGPDVLADPIDMEEILRRARARPGALPLGELLLDQRIVCGIGNIYRCEALFLDGHNPWTPQSTVDDATLAALVQTAANLMRANLGTAGRDPGAGPEQRSVYRRSGRPCRRCSTLVAARRQGEQGRLAYWCPTCQPLLG